MFSGALICLAVTVAAFDKPSPVIKNLGQHVPTPVPTTKRANKKRVISTITVQNNAEGDTVVSFEATDFADSGEGKKHIIASKSYAVSAALDDEEERAEVKAMAARVLREVRKLEETLHEYVELAGPPKPRPPIGPSTGQGAGGARPR
jgi:hypothetical protein